MPEVGVEQACSGDQQAALEAFHDPDIVAARGPRATVAHQLSETVVHVRRSLTSHRRAGAGTGARGFCRSEGGPCATVAHQPPETVVHVRRSHINHLAARFVYLPSSRAETSPNTHGLVSPMKSPGKPLSLI